MEEMPSLYMMSNSASEKGAATLFLTTLILVRLPVATPSVDLIWPMRRISTRIEEKNLRARPPGVVSGLPNMTPIFSRIWLVKMQTVRALEMRAVSLRIAALIRRAWAPTVESPISPSSSCLVTRAATESSTITSMALERTRASQICRASSPEDGWETNRSSRLTPSLRAYCGSSACSTSMKAASPPRFWAWAMTVRVRVVLPDDSGPKTSTMRPRGKPPTPRARSMSRLPVGMTSTSTQRSSPRRRMAPSPNSFWIWEMARSRLRLRASRSFSEADSSGVALAAMGVRGGVGGSLRRKFADGKRKDVRLNKKLSFLSEIRDQRSEIRDQKERCQAAITDCFKRQVRIVGRIPACRQVAWHVASRDEFRLAARIWGHPSPDPARNRLRLPGRGDLLSTIGAPQTKG